VERLNFKTLAIFITFLFTIFLFVSVATLFFIPKPNEIFKALRSNEMIYSLKLSLLAALIAVLLPLQVL